MTVCRRAIIDAAKHDKSPVDALLDVFVFAPVGFVLDAKQVVPQLAERGRNQMALLRVLGQFALTKAKRDADQKLAAFSKAGTTPPAAPPARPATATAAATDKSATKKARSSSPDTESLPIHGYDALSASQIVPRLAALRPREIEQIRRYEAQHRRRRTILSRIAQLQR